MKASIRLVIADDNDEIREILRAVLKSQETMKVVAEAKTGHEAADLVRAHKPDVVLLDVEMPRLDGCQTLQRIIQDRADTKVIMVTRKTSRAAVNRAQRLGAKGYVAKRDLHAELVTAIQAITEGGSYLSKSVGGSPSRAYLSGADAAKQVRATRSQGGDVVPSHNQKGRPDTHRNDETHIHNPIRVFLVDDEEMVGTVVSQMLQNDSRFQFVGVGHDEETVVKVMADEQPDIVLLDIFLGNQARGGWWLLKRIRQIRPDTGIITLTRSTGRANVSEAWRKGIAGYVPKRQWPQEGTTAIITVSTGKSFFVHSLGERVWKPSKETESLTPREREAFYLFVRDIPSQAMAAEMSIGVDAIHVARFNIRGKIGHQDGWKGIAKDTQRDPDLLCELSDEERRVFELYAQGTTIAQEIAMKLSCSETEVMGLMRRIRRKLNCHPDGWKGIAREEGDIE